MLASDLNPKDFEGDFEPDDVPVEVQALAVKFYHGFHPALRAVGVNYTSREDEIKRDTARRMVALVNLTGDAERADAALDALFN